MQRVLSVLCVLSVLSPAAEIPSRTTHAKAYGPTKNAVAIDPAKDLPRYPAVPPDKAIATWKVKPGFHLELAAHEPQVRSPIALCFDERGRMFVCEMIDYSELRDVTPHLGRISVLEDRDHDGYYEHSQVFADDLAWPTGLIWANGGLYVIATPDILFFKDKDDDGHADTRDIIFTGFGTGLKLLNVQGLANSPQWGQDNRIHILAGGGNRGVVRWTGVAPVTGSGTGVPPVTGPAGVPPAAKVQASGTLAGPQTGGTPVPPGIELGGKDFWFDPLTHEFGLEGGGAQYGMSFDNCGRKFACSNSDHLQHWVYDDRYAHRNPHFPMLPARQSIAADGGACEVFRISPDEPWRIIRTRWRIAGVVKGAVEGGGRVSGYFTGATGTTIYRGDQYGEEFLNNSFTGDAGGQLVHRKIIEPSEDGISLIGKRPADEQGYEFAASTDTWVRVVNFANAPDGCLHIIDMHREVIEHPWSIPDEIKQHIDLNSGHDMGRIYRLVKDGQGAGRIGQGVNLASASTAELVETLSHPNGWHRDTAQRLLVERQDLAAMRALIQVLAGDNELAKLHAIGALRSMVPLDSAVLNAMMNPSEPMLAQLACKVAETHDSADPRHADAIVSPMMALTRASDERVRYQAVLSLSTIANSGTQEDMIERAFVSVLGPHGDCPTPLRDAMASLAVTPFIELVNLWLATAATERVSGMAPLIEARAAMPTHPDSLAGLISEIAERPELVPALARGLQRAGTTLLKADATGQLTPLFTKAAATARDTAASIPDRIAAIEMLGLVHPSDRSDPTDQTDLFTDPSPDIQLAAVRAFGASLQHYATYAPPAKAAAITALLTREASATELLNHTAFKPTDLTASQVQSLLHHKSPALQKHAKEKLASVIPLTRSEVLAKYQPAIAATGDKTRGQNHYVSRCMACHRAGTLGLLVGPDLVTVKTKGRDGLLTAILDPHKEVAAQFIAYTVNTKDGQTQMGIVTDDNASALTLTMMGGLTKTLQRSDIKGSSSSGQSLMPEGLESGMTVEDMADLLTFIESL